MKRAAKWQCHHCKATVKAGEDHDCWTTTEGAELAHIVHVTHRDEVEAPLTDWLLEAYQLFDKGEGR